MWPNSVSATEVIETEIKNDDTLEAEISKLEETINELESCNDLPDVGDFDESLEEGEILDSIIFIGEVVGSSKNKENNYTCDTTDGEIFDDDDDEMTDLKHNGKSKLLCTSSNLPEVIDLTHSPNYCKTYANEKEQSQKVLKSVLSPECSEKVSTIQCNKHNEKCNASSLKSIKDDLKKKSVSREDQALGNNEILQFDIDISDFEERIKFNNGPVSSTPCRTKLRSKKWRPKFLSRKESFLILDECGEVSDQENSVCSLPLLNSTIEKPLSSKEEENVVGNRVSNDLQNVEQREVTFDQGGLKVDLKMTTDEDERQSLTVLEPSVSLNTLIEDDLNSNTNHGHTDMKGGKDRIVAPLHDEANGDICKQLSEIIEVPVSNIPNEHEVVVKGEERSVEVVDTQMSTAIKQSVIPNLTLNSNQDKGDKVRIVAPIHEEVTGDICVQSSKMIEVPVSNTPNEHEGGERSVEVVDTQMSTVIKEPGIPNLTLNSNQDRIVAPIHDEANGNICVQSSEIIEVPVSNIPNEHEVVVKGEERSVEVVDTQMSTAIKQSVIPNLSLSSNQEPTGVEDDKIKNITKIDGQTIEKEDKFDANHNPESTNEIPKEEKPKIFYSNNPQENDDNNNPEWELVRKLNTDEERYRAMRQRWRNLVVPDPNKDLTYRNWRIRQNAKTTKVSASGANKSEQKIISGSDVSTVKSGGQRKRAYSEEQTSSRMQPSAKRPRTQSCTQTYEVKLQQLRQNIEYEKQQITDEEHIALIELSVQQKKEKNYLRSVCYSYILDEEMYKLEHRHFVDMEKVHNRFEDARLAVERANLGQRNILEKACEEVTAFHKFYQGLDDSKTGDTLLLSESQLDELWATERLYEEYDLYYG